MCSACFPRSSLPADASLPSTGSSGASSPASTVLSKRYDFLPPIPPHFVAFAWRYLSVHSFFSLLGGRVRRRGLELVTRCSSREFAEETTGSPKFLGNPNVRLHMFRRRRQDCWHQTITVQQHGPWYRTAKAPTMGLSTLNSMAFGLAVYASQCRLPDTTQDSLPAAGQALPDGLFTRRVPMKGFRFTSHPPFPSLLGAMASTPMCESCAWVNRVGRRERRVMRLARQRGIALEADQRTADFAVLSGSASSPGSGPGVGPRGVMSCNSRCPAPAK